MINDRTSYLRIVIVIELNDRQCSFFESRWASVRVPLSATVPLSAVPLNCVLVAISDVYDYSLRV